MMCWCGQEKLYFQSTVSGHIIIMMEYQIPIVLSTQFYLEVLRCLRKKTNKLKQAKLCNLLEQCFHSQYLENMSVFGLHHHSHHCQSLIHSFFVHEDVRIMWMQFWYSGINRAQIIDGVWAPVKKNHFQGEAYWIQTNGFQLSN